KCTMRVNCNQSKCVTFTILTAQILYIINDSNRTNTIVKCKMIVKVIISTVILFFVLGRNNKAE
ncbi:hypothetical protein, partial [Staphylococcus pseudintermedius]|uniref:hypothetical protein n=1 Tax=Staphylococcus pseudintermedius TaxID=283734 RepID=UPI0036F2BF61